MNIWRVASSGGEPERVTTRGGSFCELSPDGRHLYYTRQDAAASVWRRDLATGAEVSIAEGVGAYRTMSATARGVWFVRYLEEGPVLFLLSNGARTPERIGALPRRPVNHRIRISPDGQSVMFSTLQREESDIMLVENFR